MADDWQVGDLALCLSAGPGALGQPNPLKVGMVLTVERVVVADTGTTGLGFVGVVFPQSRLNADDARRYRKIRPHAPDAEDAETIRLLTGAPVRVQAA